MKLKSISGLVYEVSDLKKTYKFYKNLGFRVGKPEEGRLKVYVNWFWVEFRENKKLTKNRGVGIKLFVKVDEQKQKEKEIIDPDGYKLVFFVG